MSPVPLAPSARPLAANSIGPSGPEAVSAGLGDDQLLAAWRTAREALLSERNPQGYWIGELSSSPLSTATAISALSIAERHSAAIEGADDEAADRWDTAYRTDLSELICTSARWLAEQQNDDGGWGDTDRSSSNLATTMLVLSAFRMTGVPAKFADLEPRAEAYIRSQGGAAGLKKRYGKDKTFAAPILTNCALAGVVPWKQVPALPFELAAMPQSWFKALRLPVVSYALPALVAIGLAKHHHRPSINPLRRWVRDLVTDKCLRLVTRMQPDSGGFLEATPLTSFVVMALASTGRADDAIVRRGVEFLLASVRPDGSWPIDTNLATWNTTLAVNALAKGGGQHPSEEREPNTTANRQPSTADSTLEWILACQHTERHPFTGADPGGWAWTNLSGGVPDADDTSGALIALRGYWPRVGRADQVRIATAVRQGIEWLLDLQNRDGGWPTFCRGWGALPFDRSATDLTAHAIRALHTWRGTVGWKELTEGSRDGQAATTPLNDRIDRAIDAGLRYLQVEQKDDGSWEPLWFGNETRPGEANPVVGTSRVLQALAALGRADSPMAMRGLQWLVKQQHACGGWGNAPGECEPSVSVEETSLAVEALLPCQNVAARQAIDAGLGWLSSAVSADQLDDASPIGLYFAKLWYHERLYPKVFAASALGAAVRHRVASEVRWGDDGGYAEAREAAASA